jgi:hypothetical protein
MRPTKTYTISSVNNPATPAIPTNMHDLIKQRNSQYLGFHPLARIAININQRLSIHLGPMKQCCDRNLGVVKVMPLKTVNGTFALAVYVNSQVKEIIQVQDAGLAYRTAWSFIRRIYRDLCRQYNERS